MSKATLEEITTKKAVKDRQGWTIPKDTRLYIIKRLTNPMTQRAELIVYVDNGTGDVSLMPRTLLEERVL